MRVYRDIEMTTKARPEKSTPAIPRRTLKKEFGQKLSLWK
jgi:hypothetical protein